MSLKYNLQFFADGPGGEKTEPATPKKLQDARKEGQVAKSREVVNALGLLALFIILKIWASKFGTRFMELFQMFYEMIPEAVVNWNGYLPERDILAIFEKMMVEIMLIVAPVFIVGFVVVFVGEVVQVKWMVTTKPLKPKLSKLSPISGFKRMFSANSLVELVKALLKIILIIIIVYNYVQDKWTYLFRLYDMTLVKAIAMIGEMVIELGLRIGFVYVIIALLDYIYQKVKFNKDMKMTKQEIKDEYKQQEGDPQVKGKIRQKMQEASRRRMMQDLTQADVVITNPTHYAVAIKYDPAIADAPIVVAKGEDYLARRIKEVAKEHNIEIVENKPLARMLYANVDIGQEIPPELYQAVAEVLAMVYNTRQ